MVSAEFEARQDEIRSACRTACASAVDGAFTELFEPQFHDWVELMLDGVEVSKSGKLRLHLRYVIESDESAVEFLKRRGIEVSESELEFLRSNL